MSHQPSLPGTGLRVAFVTMHTSPLERAGTADAGGMNVLIAALARALGRLGVRVDFLTRRTDPDQPTKPSSSKPTGGIKDATGKGALPQHWIGTAKKRRG